MYNRYIPGANGTFQRTVVDDRPPQPPPPPPQPAPPETTICPPPEHDQQPECVPAPGCAENTATHILRRFLPRGVDIGELLALCIVLLLLVDSDQDDTLTVLITIAVFLLF